MSSSPRYMKYVVLPGSAHPPLPGSRPAGPTDRAEVVNILVRTAGRHSPDELLAQVQKIYSQPLPKRKYLTHQELEAQYGTDDAVFDAIESFAQHFHITVVRRSGAERSIVLRGALADLSKAFHVETAMFHHAVGAYRARTSLISVPTELQDKITGVFGFDTRPKRRLHRRHGEGFRNATSLASKGETGAQFATRYQFPTSSGGVKLDGSGQTVALIELGGGYENTDLSNFFGGSAPNVTAVAVDNTAKNPTGNLPTGNPEGPDGEVALDIEVFGSVAPAARIAVYFGPNNGTGFVDTISAAVHDASRKPSVLSISWGEPDDLIEAQSIKSFSEIFVVAAGLGITVCAASGDHGVADLAWQDWSQEPSIHGYHVNHPASDPMVLGVGGTQINRNGAEVVWNDGTSLSDHGNGGWATGGGVSPVFTTVPTWQATAKVPVSLGTGQAGRGVPDVAASATNYATIVDGESSVSGGTSAATPLWAGLLVLINQAKGKNVGFVNPTLYANASKGLFTAISSGNNGIKGALKGYPAGKGWNACTGLGVPIGTSILAAF